MRVIIIKKLKEQFAFWDQQRIPLTKLILRDTWINVYANCKTLKSLRLFRNSRVSMFSGFVLLRGIVQSHTAHKTEQVLPTFPVR